MTRTALIAGATGLVGHCLLQRLLREPAYRKVRVLSRRPLDLAHERLELVQTDYRHLAGLGDALAVDDVFCCLGTTLRKAGSRAAFEEVDYRMVVALAQAARAAGSHQFLVISAVGASPHALTFYSRVKGRMERAVAGLVRDSVPGRGEAGAGTGYAAVHIVRPSLLLGHRAEQRPAEDMAQRLAPRLSRLFAGPFARYRPVAAEDVAEALVLLALRGAPGAHVHHLPLAD